MLVTAGTSALMPGSVLAPELVTMHEIGHKYWYGMVGSNEFEDAWLDEGVNSYVEVKVMDALYGRGTSVLRSRSVRQARATSSASPTGAGATSTRCRATPGSSAATARTAPSPTPRRRPCC